MSNVIEQLFAVGQSIWCDNISRAMLAEGGLSQLVSQGIVGVTSNPTIFMKAITGGSDYDVLMSRLNAEGRDTLGIYEGLVLPDIGDAADILLPVYERTNGQDGYVSLEVNPKLAYNTEETVAEARRLHKALNRPNILIKVPATDEGIPAISTLISEGISVNVTLIFALGMYEKVMQAYIEGLTKLAASGGDISKTRSVASFFVSRVDGLVDKKLTELRDGGADVDHLLGKAAIANARLAYGRFREVFGEGSAFDALRQQGGHVQRPLWASTSTKNPSYPATLYCDTLVAPDTVNTLPPATINAVLKEGSAEIGIGEDLSADRAVIDELGRLGINIDDVTDKLRVDGVNSFVDSFDELLENLASKQATLRPTGS